MQTRVNEIATCAWLQSGMSVPGLCHDYAVASGVSVDEYADGGAACSVEQQLQLADALDAYLIASVAGYLRHNGRAAMRATCRLFRDIIDETPSLFPETLTCCLPDKYAPSPRGMDHKNHAELRLSLDVSSFVRVPARCDHVRSLATYPAAILSDDTIYRGDPDPFLYQEQGYFVRLLNACSRLRHLGANNRWLHEVEVSETACRCVETLEIHFERAYRRLPTTIIEHCSVLKSLYLSRCRIARIAYGPERMWTYHRNRASCFLFPKIPNLQILGLDAISDAAVGELDIPLHWLNTIAYVGDSLDLHRLHLIVGSHGAEFLSREELELLQVNMQLQTGCFKKITVAEVQPTGVNKVTAVMEVFTRRGFAMEVVYSPLDPRTLWLDANRDIGLGNS